MDKVVITGATGFIGKALTKKLLQEGKRVYAIVRSKDKIAHLNQHGELVLVETDLESISRLSIELKAEKIDLFYHLANYARYPENSQDYFAQLMNTKFACDAITESIKMKCGKFILIGTSYQYQMNNNGTDSEYRRCSIYGAARFAAQLMCETIAHNNRMKFNTVLLPNCFGPGDSLARATNSIIKAFLSGKSPNLIEGSNKHDCLYIDDLVNGLISVAEKGIDFKTYYIGNRELRTFREIIENIRDVINPEIELNFGTYDDSSYINYSLINLDDLYKDTGFECKADFEESIHRTAKWLKELKI